MYLLDLVANTREHKHQTVTQQTLTTDSIPLRHKHGGKETPGTNAEEEIRGTV
jgi:hypothetical protein